MFHVDLGRYMVYGANTLNMLCEVVKTLMSDLIQMAEVSCSILVCTPVSSRGGYSTSWNIEAATSNICRTWILSIYAGHFPVPKCKGGSKQHRYLG